MAKPPEAGSAGDSQNVLLVAAALIAAVTLQAGMNPPGGVWQGDGNGHNAGTAIYGSEKTAFYAFLISNAPALSTSIIILTALTSALSFRFEVWVATASTYGSTLFAVTPGESVGFRYVWIAAAGPFALRFLVWIFRKLKKRRPTSSSA